MRRTDGAEEAYNPEQAGGGLIPHQSIRTTPISPHPGDNHGSTARGWGGGGWGGGGHTYRPAIHQEPLHSAGLV